MGKADTESAHRNNKTICLSFSQEIYDACIKNPVDFRTYTDKQIERFPELFPVEIAKGYLMKDISCSKKQFVLIRRIEIAGVAYTIRPSFVMPYLTGFVDEIEKALFLRKFNVPFWALSYVFGKYPMYWYRIEQSLGRNSIVGTTIRNPDDIPQHLATDLSIREWTLIQNFDPCNPRTVTTFYGYKSPTERLNQFRYHDNWLSDLCISASLGGYRSPPQKPEQSEYIPAFESLGLP
jgi:hypothetical protein